MGTKPENSNSKSFQSDRMRYKLRYFLLTEWTVFELTQNNATNGACSANPTPGTRSSHEARTIPFELWIELAAPANPASVANADNILPVSSGYILTAVSPKASVLRAAASSLRGAWTPARPTRQAPKRGLEQVAAQSSDITTEFGSQTEWRNGFVVSKIPSCNRSC